MIELAARHGTSIGWTHPAGYRGETWNPVTGCEQIPGKNSAPSGCDNCYAKRLLDTRMAANPKSVRYGKPFEVVMCHEDRLQQPLHWKTPRCIFVNSLSDLFHHDVPDAFIERVFETAHNAPQHIFQVLTKRPERMARFTRDFYVPDMAVGGARRPIDNLALGTSICTNADAWRANALRQTDAAVRFLSLEPLLDSVDEVDFRGIDWIIAGGESGPGARPMNIDHVRAIRDRCATLGIPFFLKQLGGTHDKRDGTDALLDGVTHQEFPKAFARLRAQFATKHIA